MTQVLLLGGTFDAHVLSNRLDAAGIACTYSFAGATQSRREQALPTRVGGFGGIVGLTHYLQAHKISHVIDATHPFAAQMSRHAIAACGALGIPLLSMERPPWQATAHDQWTHVADMEAAACTLRPHHHRVFLAIGRKQLPMFASLSASHHFLLRVVDQPDAPLLPAPHALIVERGPFQLDDELALIRTHAIDCIISKNAGGKDTYAKIKAARQLHLPVIMVNRPSLPQRMQCETPEEAMQWLRSQL
ncbi:cobalt-precorrin-6A reductase [Diaphorobacter sp. HDW4A]|uniref:cobalt-precorrin-6A reductase n=1 Tax=Diaphorobacter sp. HDW4A TaxID=2714924 RepID=UPI001981B120